MMTPTDEESAIVPVKETKDTGLNKTMEVQSTEPAITLNKLPKIEVSPEDKKYVYASGIFQECTAFIKSLKIEVLIFIYMFSYMMRSVTSFTMILEKVCKVNIGYSDDICNNLNMYKAEKLRVETMGNNFHLGHTLITLTPSALMSCFVGPWSDKYGRRLPLIAALLGIIVDGIGATFCAFYLRSGAQYYLISPIFSGFSGGMVCAMTVVYSYASDISEPKTRTFKYAIVELAMGLGIPLGTLAGGWIYKYYGYVPVFAASLVGHTFGLFWVICMIEETRGLDNYDCWEVKVRNFFSMDMFLEGFRASVKRRPHRGRQQLWLLLLCLSVCILALMGTMNISYLYVYHHYEWSNPKYSTVNSVFSVMGLFTMLIAVPVLTRVLKVSDGILGIMGSVGSVAKYGGIALAAKEGVYYFANLLGLLSGLSTLAGRAHISKIIPKTDLGKVFAFLSALESLIPIGASAIFSQLFNATLGAYPDPTYLVIAILMIFPLGVYIWIAFLPKVNYEEMDDSEKTTEEKPKNLEEVA